MRFSIYTLGCKSNQFESQAMAKLLCQRGHQEVPQGEFAEAFIINTCSVTAVSNKKSRQTIRGVQKQNPNTLVAVCGCYAQLDAQAIAQLQVQLIGGTGDHLAFITQLEDLVEQKNPDLHRLPYNDPKLRLAIESLPSGGLEGRTRALLKIQDGCENYCTYCVIPYARGKCRSLSLAQSALALENLLAQGYLEIIFTGIEISSWGKDLSPQKSLVDFLEMAEDLAQKYEEKEGKKIFYRLGSLEPRTITEEFCSRVSPLSSIHPHFHLSLQSGSDAVLKRMNRKYDSTRFYQSVSLIRQYFQDSAITTDLIVGFPQETDAQFTETLDFIQKCHFSAMHIFPYSTRDGTPAAKIPGQISKQEKTARAKTASAIAKEMTLQYQQGFVGKTLPVLFERQEENCLCTGLTPQHIPVFVSSEIPLQNQIHQVFITKQEDPGLQGQLLK